MVFLTLYGRLLIILENNGPSSLVDISSYHNIEKPSITRRVQRLEERRLIDVLPGKDRREKMIKLTESGEELSPEVPKKNNTFGARSNGRNT